VFSAVETTPTMSTKQTFVGWFKAAGWTLAVGMLCILVALILISEASKLHLEI
jgi:hypothetical protein